MQIHGNKYTRGTEKPKWVIWLIWAIVGQYTDIMTQKYAKKMSLFVRVMTHYMAQMSQMNHLGFSVRITFKIPFSWLWWAGKDFNADMEYVFSLIKHK